MPPSPSDYDIPRPSKIKLKTTKAETAERIYRREQRRTEKELRKIERANRGYSSPPRTRPESVSPPRYGPRAGQALDDEDEDDIPQNHAHEDWAEKLAWMAQEDFGNPFAAFDAPRMFGQRIPHRHQAPAAAGPSRRDATHEVRERGGPAPYMGAMSEEEYAAFIREGMRARRHEKDMDEMEKRRKERREADRKREMREEAAREKEAKREEKRSKQARDARREADELDAKAQRAARITERGQWRRRCAALMDGDVESIRLTFNDIPWPVYKATGSADVQVLLSLNDITIDNVRDFLYALAEDEAKGPKDAKALEHARRKVLRDARLQFHPDRFSRVLRRVRDTERDKVQEGAELTIRLINEIHDVSSNR